MVFVSDRIASIGARVTADWLIPCNFGTATAAMPKLRMAQWLNRLLL